VLVVVEFSSKILTLRNHHLQEVSDVQQKPGLRDKVYTDIAVHAPSHDPHELLLVEFS
jgi:hypothetical protein